MECRRRLVNACHVLCSKTLDVDDVVEQILPWVEVGRTLDGAVLLRVQAGVSVSEEHLFDEHTLEWMAGIRST